MLRKKIDKLVTQQQNIPLKEVFDEWKEKYLDKNKRSAVEIYRSFEIHIFPKLGDLPASRLTFRNWLNVLEPLAEIKPSVAERIVGNAKQMYNWAIKREICTVNPLQNINTRDDLNIEYIPKDRTLDDDEIKYIWQAMFRGRVSLRNRILFSFA